MDDHEKLTSLSFFEIPIWLKTRIQINIFFTIFLSLKKAWLIDWLHKNKTLRKRFQRFFRWKFFQRTNKKKENYFTFVRYHLILSDIIFSILISTDYCLVKKLRLNFDIDFIDWQDKGSSVQSSNFEINET